MEASTKSSTMATLMTLAAEMHADNVAIVHKEGDEWHEVKYGQMGEIVKSIAKGLIANGITLGDKIAILGNTRPEWSYADFASLCAGAVVAPIYQTNSPEECEYVLNHSEAKLLFLEDTEQLEKINKIRPQLQHLEKIVVMNPDVDDFGDAITLEELKQQGREVADDVYFDRVNAVQPDDLCTIVYTSGTTGPPKGCLITHDNFRNTTTMGESTIIGDPEELVYLFLPLAHVFARLVQFVSFDVGATLAYWQCNPQMIIADVMELKPHALPSVPRIFEKLYVMANTAAEAKSPEEQVLFHKAIEVGLKVRMMQARGEAVPADLQAAFDAADEPVYALVRNLFGGRMKRAVTGAAPIAQEILEFFFACGVPVYEGYGMTETSTLATANNALTGFKFGSVGKPVPGCTVKIAEDGEIMIGGPNIFQGYYKNPSETAETIDGDGWLHTGDLGKIDDDGFVHITGRKKDIIITAGGKNLTPANFENAMKQNRWVSQAVMFGDRRPYPVALLTLDPEEVPALAAKLGIEVTDTIGEEPAVREEIQAVVDKVNEKFASVEQVKKFRILDHDLTMESGDLTPSMKVKRNVVYDKYADVFAAMYDE
ncbi:MAG: AMP-dependent synthetase/ligase [Solirubrobacterales bacterium]